MSKVFDLLSGKADGPVAAAEARAEYSEGMLGAVLEENEKQRSEIERLRAALELIQSWGTCYGQENRAAAIAREALSKSSNEQLSVCPACNGLGIDRLDNSKCSYCDGKGRVR